MARKHYWQFLVTDEGNPIENASISIYTAGTEDPVFVYTDEVGAAGTQVAPQVATSRKGYFEFWISDENEANGYPLDTKFKLAWSAAGVSDGYIDYIDVFSTSIAEVDETDANTLRNKAVSNFLAKGWEDHKNETLPIDAPHGLGFVDEGSTNDERNRLVSDYLAYIWDYHAKRQWDGTSVAISTPTQAPDMHGIEQVDEADSGDTDKNKLVSNALATGWEEHIDNVVTDSHPQYPLADATGTQFTGKIRGVSTTSGDPDTTLVTKDFIDGNRFSEAIAAGSWTDNLDGTYSYTVTHNLNILYPLVMIWDTDAAPAEIVSPLSVVNGGVNAVVVTVTNPVDHFVRVVI